MKDFKNETSEQGPLDLAEGLGLKISALKSPLIYEIYNHEQKLNKKGKFYSKSIEVMWFLSCIIAQVSFVFQSKTALISTFSIAVLLTVFLMFRNRLFNFKPNLKNRALKITQLWILVELCQNPKTRNQMIKWCIQGRCFTEYFGNQALQIFDSFGVKKNGSQTKIIDLIETDKKNRNHQKWTMVVGGDVLEYFFPKEVQDAHLLSQVIPENSDGSDASKKSRRKRL